MNLEKARMGCPSNNIKIGIAKTLEEKRDIYHLRYHIYVEEIPYRHTADHVNKLIYDDLDEWGTLFYAKIGSKLIGTVRVNIGQLVDFSPEIVQIYLMNRFEKFYENKNHNFGLASKGMVASPYRKSPVFTMLMTKVFEMYCDKQVHFGFGNTNLYLLPLHEYYGHRRIGRNIADLNFGLASSLVIMPGDIRHLEKVNSPFLKVVFDKSKLQNDQVVDWFKSEFPETASIINSQLVTEEKLWEILRARLGKPPNEVMPILQGLSEAEAKKFLHCCGVIVQCYKGDYIATRGDACQELNLLLSGTLQSFGVKNIYPGQHFGAIGLVNRTKHISNIIAVTDIEILVLSFHYFQKFRRSYSKVANKVLRNLAGINDRKDAHHVIG